MATRPDYRRRTIPPEPPTRRLRGPWPLLAALVTLSVTPGAEAARAHGGEDHGAPEPAHVHTHGDTRRAEAHSPAFEAVVRWEAREAGEPTAVSVLVADFATSAPAPAGTTLDLLFAGPAQLELRATPTGEPGAFASEVRFPTAGHYALTLVVTAPGRSDLLLVDEVDVGPPEAEPPPAEPHTEGVPTLWLALALVLAGVLALLGFLAGRRGAASVALLALLAPSLERAAARAHGGEDHGAPANAPTAAAGGAVTLPLEAQFLLGLGTQRATERELTTRLRVTGRVTAPPGAHVTLTWPHAARVEIAPDTLGPAAGGAASFPRIGQRVEKGQVLAQLVELADPGDRASLRAERLRASGEIRASEARVRALRQDRDRKRQLGELVSQQELADAEAALAVALAELDAARATVLALNEDGPVLRLPLVAPTAGIVASVSATPGTFVAADAPIITLVDSSVLWVEARVFETDLARVVPGAPAVVTSDTRPGVDLVARPIGDAPTVDPTTRTRTLLFSLDGSEGLLIDQWVGVDLAAGAPVRAPVVPTAALVDIDGRPVVWVKAGAERFEPRGVAVLATEGAWVAVRGDLHAGERVVVAGAAFLRGAAPDTREARPARAPTPAAHDHEEHEH